MKLSRIIFYFLFFLLLFSSVFSFLFFFFLFFFFSPSLHPLLDNFLLSCLLLSLSLSFSPSLCLSLSISLPLSLFLSRLEKRRGSSRRLCISRANRQLRNVFRRLSTSPLSFRFRSFFLSLLPSTGWLTGFDSSPSVSKGEYARNFRHELRKTKPMTRWLLLLRKVDFAREFARVPSQKFKAGRHDYSNNIYVLIWFYEYLLFYDFPLASRIIS